MSWLARSIANSLKLDDDEDDVDVNDNHNHSPKSDHDQDQSTDNTPRGVKEDLSELTKSFSRQLWGVASFLAPPPQTETPLDSDQSPPNEEAVIQSIKSDFAEIGGTFKIGISKLSNNISVSEITKMASNFLQLGSDADPMDAVGVTDEVLLFARDIAMHPETWLDFPVPDEDEDFDDFELSDAQQEHALAVERLAPRLAALRIELCPEHMSENCFWKIYFLLLHPRLTKEDALILSTPQVVEARAMLSSELKNRTKGKSELVGSRSGTSYDFSRNADLAQKDTLAAPSFEHPESVPLEASAHESTPAVAETDKHPVESTEMQVVDKSVVKEEPIETDKKKKLSSFDSSHEVVEVRFEDHDDDWLKEENSEMAGVGGSTMNLGDDEDVTFSDLEDDDDDIPTNYKKGTSGSDSSTKDSKDWVQLSGDDTVKDIKPVGSQQQVSAPAPKSKDSNDWLDFDDIGEV